jgi:hypothetical protein
MKKTLFVSLFILACAMTCISYAQSSDIAGGKLQSGSAKLNFASENSGTPSRSGPVPLNDINTKALRDFMTSYKNAADVRWTILPDGFRVHFYVDGIQTRIFYNKKGNREAMIRYYNEDKLPFAIRYQVKTGFFDFAISQVTEVTAGNKTVYLVKIEDKTSGKTIEVAEGEMEVAEEHLKG